MNICWVYTDDFDILFEQIFKKHVKKKKSAHNSLFQEGLSEGDH